MPSKSMYKAFDTLATTFQKLNRTPIEWDKTKQRWRYTEDRWELKVWYFDITVVVFCGMFFSTWGMLGKQALFPDGRISFFKLLVLWALGLLEIAGLIFFITMIHFGSEYVQGYNQLMELEQNLQRIESSLKSTQYGKAGSEDASGHGTSDILGKILIPIIHFFYHSPVSLTLCAVFLNLDPFIYLIHYVEDYMVLSQTTRILFHVLRTLLLLVTALEVCRLWPLLILLLISHLIMINDVLKVMHRTTKKIGVSGTHYNQLSRLQSQFLRLLMNKYSDLQLTLVLSQPLLLNVTFILISIGLFVCSLCNFAVIKFISIIPFVIYQFFLSVSIIVPFVLHATLPYCHRINDQSTDLIGLWKSLNPNLGVMKRGYWLRHAKSIQNLKIYTGIKRLKLFWLGKKTKMKYQDVIVMRTVDLLLSIPQSSLQNIVLEASMFAH